MIDGKNFFDQPINISMKIYDSIRNILKGQGHDYTSKYLIAFL